MDRRANRPAGALQPQLVSAGIVTAPEAAALPDKEGRPLWKAALRRQRACQIRKVKRRRGEPWAAVCSSTSGDSGSVRALGSMPAAHARTALLGPAHRTRGPHRCVFNNPIIPTHLPPILRAAQVRQMFPK